MAIKRVPLDILLTKWVQQLYSKYLQVSFVEDTMRWEKTEKRNKLSQRETVCVMAFINYYKVLGVDRHDEYDHDKIRDARNRLLKEYTSDKGNVNMGEAEKQLRDT